METACVQASNLRLEWGIGGGVCSLAHACIWEALRHCACPFLFAMFIKARDLSAAGALQGSTPVVSGRLCDGCTQQRGISAQQSGISCLADIA